MHFTSADFNSNYLRIVTYLVIDTGLLVGFA